ncbi:hypothetical protein J2I47_02495 [Fibrella sp. HMF5335]|uniref:Uncharacterized protein n=1 Tax=Fibrella rubiginis TaxID=2817060 RepID=A0A939K395_9BACT|nr:hypothetical protein [Fibrella rubiginis]MBO0935408.1 hypothetical protein [Fibrella rubiginis]
MTNLNPIKLSDFFNISSDDAYQYKLHLACQSPGGRPLDAYLSGWDNWLSWNQHRANKNDFNRTHIFSLIEFHHEPGKWLFGGIFKVVERHEDYSATQRGYSVVLSELYKDYIGRLIIDFHRYQGMRGRAFLLESYFNDLIVAEVLKRPFDGIKFPGYENINLSFLELELLYKY